MSIKVSKVTSSTEPAVTQVFISTQQQLLIRTAYSYNKVTNYLVPGIYRSVSYHFVPKSINVWIKYWYTQPHFISRRIGTTYSCVYFIPDGVTGAQHLKPRPTILTRRISISRCVFCFYVNDTFPFPFPFTLCWGVVLGTCIDTSTWYVFRYVFFFSVSTTRSSRSCPPGVNREDHSRPLKNSLLIVNVSVLLALYVVPVVSSPMAGYCVVYSAYCIVMCRISCVVVLWPQSLYLSSRKNRHGHWVCCTSTGRKNGWMWRTYTTQTVRRCAGIHVRTVPAQAQIQDVPLCFSKLPTKIYRYGSGCMSATLCVKQVSRSAPCKPGRYSSCR